MAAGPWTHLPPPPGSSRPSAEGLPAPIRRIAGVVAVVAFADGLVLWLLSFAPGAPTAAIWPMFVFPAFFALFPVLGVTMLDAQLRQRGRPAARTQAVPLRGWRARAASVAYVIPAVSFVLVLASGDLSGQPERDGDRYVTNNHGEIVELTSDEWRRAEASQSRLFASGVLAFAGVAALALTQPDDEEDDDEPPLPPPLPDRPVAARLGPVTGVTPLAATTSEEPDAVVARIRGVVPVRAQARSAAGGIRVHATWDQTMRWPDSAYPVRLDGEVRAVGPSGAALEITIRPDDPHPWRNLVAHALAAMMMVAIGAFMMTGPGHPLADLVFILLWIGGALFVFSWHLTGARRATRRAAREIAAALYPL